MDLADVYSWLRALGPLLLAWFSRVGVTSVVDPGLGGVSGLWYQYILPVLSPRLKSTLSGLGCWLCV